MALRDVRNFQFFKEAVVQRFRNPDLKSFKGIPYEPQTNPQTIFGRIYNTFRELIGKGLNLHQYLNIGERSILENLYRNLQRDPNLKFLNKPDAALNDPRLALSDQYFQEQPQTETAAQQTEALPAQTPVSTSEGMVGGPGLPSAPSISSGPRRVYNIPHAPEPPKPEIAIANKSGVVAEPPPPKSELVVANKGGVVKETPAGSKLVTANSSGTLKGLGGEAPTKQIFIANKGGVVTGVRNIKSPSWLKTFGSNAQIFARKNLGKVTGGLLDIAKGIGRGIAGPGLTGTYNLLGKAGNGALNAFERLSNPGLRGASGSFVSSGSKKMAWGLVGVLIFFVLFSGLIGGLPGTVPTGVAAPVTPISADISSCKFTRAGNSRPIKSSILLGWINSAAASAGIPSPILASVAMHESQDFVVNADNNHDAIKSNNYCIKGLVFCEKSGQVLHSKSGEDDPCTSDEITGGAKTAQGVGLMQLLDIYNPEKDLCSITENLNIAAAKLKTNGLTQQPTQDQVNVAIKSYYNSCTYDNYSYCNEVWQDLQNCQVQSQTVPPPPADGNYQKWVGDFGISINNGFVPDVYKWAYEVLASTPAVAPKFKTLLGTSPIEVKPTCGISHTEGRTIFLRNRMALCVTAGIVPEGPTIESDFFKQVFIHELGHIINGSSRPGKYGDQIKNVIAAEGYLTAYSKNAATADDEICGAGNSDTRADEDFAESISYFINNGITVKDYGPGCVISADELGLNPFNVKVNGQRKYPAHYQFMTELLK